MMHLKHICNFFYLSFSLNPQLFFYVFRLVTDFGYEDIHLPENEKTFSLPLNYITLFLLVTYSPSVRVCVTPLCKSSLPYNPKPMPAQHRTDTTAKVTFRAAIDFEALGFRSQHLVKR